MIEYVIQALTWSLFGLAFGWFICYSEIFIVREVKEAIMTQNGDQGEEGTNGLKGQDSRGGPGGVGGVGGVGGTAAEGGTGGTGGTGGVGGPGGSGNDGPHHGPSPQSRRLLGIFLMVMALAIGANAWYSADRDKKIAQCQAQFNADFAKVVDTRNKYAEEDRIANVKKWDEDLKMWQALVSFSATTATRLEAVQAYTKAVQVLLDTTHKNEQLRDANPLPKLEDRDC